jgi:cysteine desulfurase
MNMRVYLDYNASTPLDPRVVSAFSEGLKIYGNPSSIHSEGRDARSLIDESRIAVARLLNCDHRQLLFTSGGTEANNLAIIGAARVLASKRRHIVTSAIEHSSVLNPCRELEREGFQVTYVPPTSQGVIELHAVRAALRSDTALVSIMLANNEIGTIQPIPEIAGAAHEAGAIMHCDAIQAVGKIPVDVGNLGADLVTVSAHKIYGPKGVGALYHHPTVDLHPLLRGGSHEKGLRAGTENVAAVHAFGVAAQLLLDEGLPNLIDLRQRLERKLEDASISILCKDAERLPNTVNFYSQDWPGESMVMMLDLEGFAVSNGSACSAGIIEPSHVILALGYNEAVARSVIRVSIGKYTTEQEVERFLSVVCQESRGRVHT